MGGDDDAAENQRAADHHGVAAAASSSSAASPAAAASAAATAAAAALNLSVDTDEALMSDEVFETSASQRFLRVAADGVRRLGGAVPKFHSNSKNKRERHGI